MVRTPMFSSPSSSKTNPLARVPPYSPHLIPSTSPLPPLHASLATIINGVTFQTVSSATRAVSFICTCTMYLYIIYICLCVYIIQYIYIHTSLLYIDICDCSTSGRNYIKVIQCQNRYSIFFRRQTRFSDKYSIVTLCYKIY